MNKPQFDTTQFYMKQMELKCMKKINGKNYNK